jgi:hypothetical protein
MKKLIDVLFDLICDSKEGLWITNNDDINGDQHDIWLENDEESLCMMYENENVKINYRDIISLTFQYFSNMIIAVLKIKDKKPLLIHIM